MDALGSSLKRMTDRVSEGSFATRANRTRGLQAIARELRKLGYELPAATSLKPKHVTALIRRWKERGIQDPTIRNRLGWVRWWAEHINKRSLLPRSNDNFGLAKRSRYSGNRARRADPELLDKIRDPRIRLALTLKAAFGLRREEALKFRPSASDKGDYLALVPSTTKGGRYREIPIIHPKQRKLLEEVRRLAGSGSLIPDGVSYRAYLQRYKSETRRAGIGRAHGLRHGYAQWRYLVLTGWRCPAAGGPTVEFMIARDAARDRAARLQIARELGHGRLDVTDTYLGRRYAAHVRLAAG
ncbi:phage integrase N-terminal domain-containing protein [Xanthobacter sp.]|uniref:phage integrase N-terminal domain-containing protein n=1 Tax=Xanthobacter sp. TaxID=35809 RepID=UPI0025E9FBCE|nr:phage integrase N-terminal domain-containing protein [Xanthobacter sp.]